MKAGYYSILFLMLIFVSRSFATEIEIAAQRYYIDVGGTKVAFPYECSHDLLVQNESVTRLIYAIHSSSYNAKSYYHRAQAMLDKTPEQKDKTMIIAPHFLKKNKFENPESSGILYWEVSPFWGSSKGVFEKKKIKISSYDVTDIILKDLVTNSSFPNLKTVIILGHSAGGQMTNRYAAVGRFEPEVAKPKGVEVRYIVMAPSSCVYFNTERVVPGSRKQFEIIENRPEKFNDWGYGLDNWYSYHSKSKLVTNSIVQEYRAKKVLYLVGSKDCDENDTSLDKSEAAMLMGRHRLERAVIYYNYLKHIYGIDIERNQYLRIIEGAGHNGRSLMLSKSAIVYTFSE